MQAVADSLFSATLVNPSSESMLDMGARVEVPVTRAIVSYWRRATLDETTWTVALEAPSAPGEYLLVWRTGDPEPPEYETFIPLIVTTAVAVETSDYPIIDPDDVRPTPDEVASLENTRLVAGGSREVIEFDDETNPTLDQVERLIEQAVPLVLAELPDRVPPSRYEAVKTAIGMYVAMLIEGSHFREGVDEGSAELWRTLYNTVMMNLKRNIDSDLKESRRLRARTTTTGPQVLA